MSNSTVDVGAFTKLQKTERREKLLQSGLVRKYQEGDNTIGLLVFNGSIRANDLSDKYTQPFPRELLANDSPVAKEAQEILLSENRIVLDGNLRQAQKWLNNQGDAVKLIHTLDVRFFGTVLRDWEKNAVDWEDLMAFIAINLDIEQLELNLDAGRSFESYQMTGEDEEDLEYVRDIYIDIIETAQKLLDGRRLKSLNVYWAVFHDLEAEHERMIMGPDYDSINLGKIPSSRRSPWFPHGAPTKRLEWERGMKLDN